MRRKNHPMQPVVLADDGVIRFKENKIVSDLLDFATSSGHELNEISQRGYSADDYSQLLELIGYSVSGYGSLESRCNKIHLRRADRIECSILSDLKDFIK